MQNKSQADSKPSSSRQLSTSLSDGILALSALSMAWVLLNQGSIRAAIGFLLIAAAACLGVYRFSQTSPQLTLISWHRYFSWLAQVIGLPFIAAAYLHGVHANFANLFIATGIALVMLQRRILSSEVCKIASEVIGGLAIVSVLIHSIVSLNGFGIVGTVLIVVAGLAVKTEGELFGFLRVDIFHYLLAVSNVALMKGLIVSNLPPLYYKA